METKLETLLVQNPALKSRKKGNGEISLKHLKFPTDEETKLKISRKLGEKPSLPADLPKGNWSEQSLTVLRERYLTKDSSGQIIETPDELVWRVAWEIASAEVLYGGSKKETLKIAIDFYRLMISHKFLPNSPTLMNAGTGNKAQYSGCFVLPVDDSLVGIFDALKYQALIHQTGGGTGFSFTRLRPHGSIVKSSSGVASGPVSFMKIFDAATNQIKQGGKRRGANMGVLRVDHPDINEFIHCKGDGGMTNFNISVAITDAFMKAYAEGGEYELVNPKDGSVSGKLSARKVFDEIAASAWKTGDPGIVFIDRINNGPANPVPFLGPIESTNPCGEQPLYPYDVCNLGSIFLTYFVKKVNGINIVDWDGLKETTRLAVRFLDNVIDVNPFPLDQIRQVAHTVRRIGLGVGGWADMITKLGIPYNSQEAIDLAEKVMKTIQDEAAIEDENLAIRKGPFPLWRASIYKEGKPRRNGAITTIAPTGTISIIADSSSGIEPLFAVAYQHKVKDEHLDRTLTFFNPIFEETMRQRGLYRAELMEKVAREGFLHDLDEIPADIRSTFVTAHEIDFEWHVKIQAAFQKYTDNAVSKTINLRNEATVEDVKRSYLLAWELGCKGITVYRDGCKSVQVLNVGDGSRKTEPVKLEPVEIKPRPVRVEGATYKIATPLGSAFITINQDSSGNPFEIFVIIGKAGSEIAAMAEALGRMISTTLRFGNHITPLERAKEIMDQLQGIGGSRSVGFGPNKVRSLPDAIAKAIGMHFGLLEHGKHETKTEPAESNDHNNEETNRQIPLLGIFKDICPSCGEASFAFQEGCKKCYSCGYSEC